MREPNENIAVWLMPRADEGAFFASLIRDLGARLDAPPFEPHLTLHGGGDIDPLSALRSLRAFGPPAGIELAVDGVVSSEKYTKTLFVRFHPSSELLALRNAVAHALHLEAADEFDPHVSLLYKDLPPAEKAELAQALKLPFTTVVFDRFQLIAHPPEIKTADDVRAWRTLA